MLTENVSGAVHKVSCTSTEKHFLKFTASFSSSHLEASVFRVH